jgi:His/Glu/Gln/Arg/opine family amino acid ABC transporter permease subunit
MQLFDLAAAQEYIGPLLLGLVMTVSLTFVVIIISLVVAIPVALGRLSPQLYIRVPMDAYVEVARATPLLLQLVYIYYVLPSVGIILPALVAAVIGLTFNYTAYMSEVYRGGIRSMARGQWDAAAALGMTNVLAFRRIILPQVIRMVTPALGNYFIALFKDTSLASVVSVQEMLFKGQIIASRSFQYFTIYTLICILYFAVGYPSSLFVRYLERITSRGYSRKKAPI